MKYRVEARLAVELIVEAESQAKAREFVTSQIESTQPWQAWGEPCNTPGLVEWVTGIEVMANTRIREIE